MGRFLGVDSVFYQKWSRAADLLVLVLLFLLCSLPLISCVAAVQGLNKGLQQLRSGNGSWAAAYFQGFKENFRRSLFLSGGLLLLAATSLWEAAVLSSQSLGSLSHSLLLLFLLLRFLAAYLFVGLWQARSGKTGLVQGVVLTVDHVRCNLDAYLLLLLSLYLVTLIGLFTWNSGFSFFCLLGGGVACLQLTGAYWQRLFGLEEKE